MQGKIDVSYANKHLIASGGFHCFDDGISRLRLTYRDDAINLDVNLISNDDQLETSKLELHPKSDDTLELRLSNYQWVNKEQTIGPIAAGEIAEQPFFIFLGISGGTASSPRRISYSIYVEDDISPTLSQ